MEDKIAFALEVLQNEVLVDVIGCIAYSDTGSLIQFSIGKDWYELLISER